MNFKRKIKQFIELWIISLLPGFVNFPKNRNDCTGALYKAWGHVINSNMGGISSLEYIKEVAFVNHFWCINSTLIGCIHNPILLKCGDKK